MHSRNYIKILPILLMCIFLLGCQNSNTNSRPEKESEKYTELKYLLEDSICHQIVLFDQLMNNHNFVPNSWNGKNAEIYVEKGADRMVQPRMVQFVLNLMIINRNKPHIFKDLPCNTLIYSSLEKYVIDITSDYSILMPWKYNHDLSNKVDEPMNIYDIGDWLTVVSVLAKQDNNQKLISYIKALARFSINEFNQYSDKNNFPDSFTYGFKSTRGIKAEIGHLTLYLDGLLHSYIVTKDKEVLSFVKARIDGIIFNNDGLLLEVYNGDVESNYSTMMTYGELSETILFLHYVTGDRKYLNIAYGLLKEMVDNFKIDDESDKVVLTYKLPLSESYCSEAMSLEASSYNVLKLGVMMNDNKITETILSHLSSYYMHGTRGGLPINRYCNTGSDDMLNISHYYGLMKTLWFVERNKLKIKGVDAKDWLEEIIRNLEMHKVKYGYVNILSDRGDKIVNEPGGNVWIFNEGLIPIYYSLMNNKDEFDLDYISKNEYFAGCNFILIDKDN